MADKGKSGRRPRGTPKTTQATSVKPGGSWISTRKGTIVIAVGMFGVFVFGLAMIFRALMDGDLMDLVVPVIWTGVALSILAKSVLVDLGLRRPKSRHRHEWTDE